MIYKPKLPQFINATKFESIYKDVEELQKIGLSPIPNYMGGYCNCGKPLTEHGMIGGKMICPNQYIIYEGNAVTGVMSADNFEKIYKPVLEDVIEVDDACKENGNEENNKTDENN